MFVAIGDLFYRGGSLYVGAGDGDLFIVGWAIMLVAILGAALVVR